MKDHKMAPNMPSTPCAPLRAMVCALALVACTEQLDAGSSRPHGALPVDERSPVIMINDGAYDNWDGEYALLLANGGGSKVVAMIVTTGASWLDIKANVNGWRGLVDAARQSGLQSLPEVISSLNTRLTMPASGKIEDTQATGSEGAWLIVKRSAQLALPYRPVVVATGGGLTDVADAYLLDPGVADRVVVVSSLGALSATGAAMAMPNGEIDPWADFIVASRFRYVQVSAFYDQLADVPDSRLSELPANALGDWMRAKQPRISQNPVASDQVSLLAVSLPGFVAATREASVTLPFAAGSNAGPALTFQSPATPLVVTKTSGALASARLWELLLSPAIFSQ
jgi:hypothetical protein